MRPDLPPAPSRLEEIGDDAYGEVLGEHRDSRSLGISRKRGFPSSSLDSGSPGVGALHIHSVRGSLPFPSP